MPNKKYRVAIVGAKGMLARMVLQLAPAEWDVVALSHPQFDLTDSTSARMGLSAVQPEIIINCAAYTDVDGAESNKALAFSLNAAGPKNLAMAAKELNAILVHISSDYVFGGDKTSPYSETDFPNPRSVYGKSKLQGEQMILDSGLERFFIIRTSWLYGPGGKNFVESIIRLAKQREELCIVADQFGSPTYTADLTQAIFNLLAEQTKGVKGKRITEPLYGIYHYSNEEQCSWHQFAREIVSLLETHGETIKAKRILPIPTIAYPLPAPRPSYSVLSKAKYQKTTGAPVPNWRQALARYMANRETSQG